MRFTVAVYGLQATIRVACVKHVIKHRNREKQRNGSPVRVALCVLRITSA